MSMLGVVEVGFVLPGSTVVSIVRPRAVLDAGAPEGGVNTGGGTWS